jgi:uncharacterized protein (DUF1015 family)
VRIIRGQETAEDTPEDNVYTRAAQAFQSWIRGNVLISESEPALYPYHQEYEVPGQSGVRKQRRGFIGLCRLEDYSARVVHRHEETLSGPKADRLELLSKTRAHFGQVFFLYSDPQAGVEAALAEQTRVKPWEQLTDEYGTQHSVWRVPNSAVIEEVVRAMRDKKLVIADGHHRYETALAYRNQRRATAPADGGSDFVMATFVRMETDGLTILSTHRVIHDLPAFDWDRFRASAKTVFDWEEPAAWRSSTKTGKDLQEMLRCSDRDRPALAAYAGGNKVCLLRLKEGFDLASALPDLPELERQLDVVILHRLLLERALGIDARAVREEKNIRYLRDPQEAITEVDSGKAQVCFLMNPTPIQAVRDVAFAGLVMPQKSTDFYPKLLSGLTLYWLDNPLGM